MTKVLPSFARALTGNGSRQIGPCMAVCSTGIRLKGLAYPNVTAATIVSIALAVGKDETYGVDYGVSDHVLGPYSDEGSEKGPRVLRTIPGHVIGPGHNTVITGPDHETDYITIMRGIGPESPSNVY